MSDVIDWSKAPEGATHYFHNTGGGVRSHWIKACDGRYWIDKEQDMKSWKVDICPVELNLAISRPQQAPWAGEGLPPVGVKCEAKFTTDWVGFEMLFCSNNYVVFKTSFEVLKSRQDFDRCGVQFRPIRTPEQIAADEREAAIVELKREFSPTYSWMAGQMYDTIARLGYRKQ